ncbi:hypothetical protein ACE38W_01825 [Chitinophaga sp. Hz27]|uniref:hypothetical protein n=1 Tax=Chitinophaga sp. Hz27 TaxID=3347169 RepID=UPI0035DD64D1
MKNLLLVLLGGIFSVNCAAQQTRWKISGNEEITWKIKHTDTAHTDQIEMSGKQVSAIITYGTGSAQVASIKKRIIFPMLRTIPNNTHASLKWAVDEQYTPVISINQKAAVETVDAISFNGVLTMRATLGKDISFERNLFPSVDKAALIEECSISNHTNATIQVNIPNTSRTDSTPVEKGVYGVYLLHTAVYGAGAYEMKPGDVLKYAIVYAGRRTCDQPYFYAAAYEHNKRLELVDGIAEKLVLETPDPVINKMFAFAKLRVTESIYDTKGGLMHGPGGGAYYAAIWANDQAEYANPFFPFLGNIEGNESALNSFRMFASFMNPAYKPLPSSIIAEGTGTWAGAGDRGDQAMIAYGASRFALAYGDKYTAQQLWPLIEWCLEFLRKKTTSEGVILSDADELEGRFPAGKINLSTNTLAYGALVSASDLAAALGNATTAKQLAAEAAALKINIDKYFGANVQGYTTYRYFDGNDKLRAWIGIPLTMGIFDRKEGTLKAMYSPYLWTSNGMLTEAGSKTFWDRALLYGLRGTFYAGATDSATKYLQEYSQKRLLGEHVPYAIEAWPEGDQRHLAAESGLYCRIITEGLFGIRVTGFHQFQCQPYLPQGWQKMTLRHIRALNDDFDIVVERKSKTYVINIKQKNGAVQQLNWDGKQPLNVTLQ